METTMILGEIAFAVLGIGLFLLAIYAVMRLWNGLVPSLFNRYAGAGPRLRFVQAIGLFFLARLLFGFGGFGPRGFGPRGYERHQYWQEQREKRNTVQPSNWRTVNNLTTARIDGPLQTIN